jgi:hypothetical protein
VELGQQYQVEMGVEAEPRDVRIVWAQDEADGQIVGVQFLDGDGSVPPPPVKGATTAPPQARTSRPPSTDPKRPRGASTAPPVKGASTAPPPSKGPQGSKNRA